MQEGLEKKEGSTADQLTGLAPKVRTVLGQLGTAGKACALQGGTRLLRPPLWVGLRRRPEAIGLPEAPRAIQWKAKARRHRPL